MNSLNVIIIGAGMGGLAAAIRLAHAGHRVTVYESAAGPGGKMRTLRTNAGPVDAGPTVMTLRGVFDTLFADVGAQLDDYVTLEPEPHLARHFWPDGSTLDLFADPQASADAVAAFAGARAARDFRRFAAKSRRLFAAFERPMMHAPRPRALKVASVVLGNPALVPAMAPGATLAQSLVNDFKDPRLRQLFGRYATYVGGSPYATPALLALIWHAEAAGIWRVTGGMHMLAQAMAKLAIERGAQIHYDAPVAQIVTGQGRVTGVSLPDSTRQNADLVVFNGDPRALSYGYLGTEVVDAVPPQAVEPRSLSAEVWAFAATPKGVDLAHHNVFFGADPHSEFDPIAKGKAPRDPTIYVCAQDRGTGRAPPTPERFEIIINAASDTYDQEFSACHQRAFRTLQARGLTLSPMPGAAALTTPEGFNALFPGSGGALYGRSPEGMMAAFARPTAQTAIPGLYLAGGGTHPGAGVPMATLSGGHAAATILNDPTLTSTCPQTAMPGGMSTG